MRSTAFLHQSWTHRTYCELLNQAQMRLSAIPQTATSRYPATMSRFEEVLARVRMLVSLNLSDYRGFLTLTWDLPNIIRDVRPSSDEAESYTPDSHLPCCRAWARLGEMSMLVSWRLTCSEGFCHGPSTYHSHCKRSDQAQMQ